MVIESVNILTLFLIIQVNKENNYVSNVGIGTPAPEAKLHLDDGHIRSANHFKFRALDFQDPNDDQLWLLVVNQPGNNEVIGSVYGQRSTGYHGAARVDIVISTSSQNAKVGGHITTMQVLEANELWSLVTVDYAGVEYIALRYQGQQYAFTELYFDGLVNSDFSENIFKSFSSSSFNSLEPFDYATTKKTIMASNVGIGTAIPEARLDVDGIIQASGEIFSSGERVLTEKDHEIFSGVRLLSTGGSFTETFFTGFEPRLVELEVQVLNGPLNQEVASGSNQGEENSWSISRGRITQSGQFVSSISSSSNSVNHHYTYVGDDKVVHVVHTDSGGDIVMGRSEATGALTLNGFELSFTNNYSDVAVIWKAYP